MSDPLMTMRWAYAPVDQRWHVLPEGGPGPDAWCRHRLPRGSEIDGTPSGLTCPCCEAVFRAVEDPKAQRGRLWVSCTRLDTGSPHRLLVTHEWNGAAWTIHAPATVRIEAAEMVFACEAVLMRARQVLKRAGQVETP